MVRNDLLSLTLLLSAPHSMSIVAMKELKIVCLTLFLLPNKNCPLVAMTQSPEVACHSSEMLPSTFLGKFLEVIWHELATWVQG